MGSWKVWLEKGLTWTLNKRLEIELWFEKIWTWSLKIDFNLKRFEVELEIDFEKIELSFEIILTWIKFKNHLGFEESFEKELKLPNFRVRVELGVRYPKT